MTEAPPSNQLLQQLKALGSATSMVDTILDLLGHTQFFDDFTRDDILHLAPYLQLYRAEPGELIIREGDRDDYMLFILKGRIDIVKTDETGQRRRMTAAGPGATLGEMSMIDGEPRFATCLAIDTTTLAVFSRDGMVRIIMEQPALGAKILIRLVTLLSQRLRETSTSLLHYLQRSDAV
jgi:CRP-like cAMP-binding protein